MAADIYSSTLGVLLMGTGNDNNTWGTNLNSSVFQVLEDAIVNALTSSVTGGTLDLSGSPPPAAASQVRYSALIFNGTLGSNQIIQVPNLRKFWWVQNSTSGAFTLKIKTPSGTASSAIPQNAGWQLVQCDGSNVITVSPFNSVQVQMPDGSAALPPFSNINEPNSGWYRAGTQDWRLSIGGLAVLQVTGAGAASPSVVNVLSPNSLQVGGAQVIPPGTEIQYAGLVLPAGGWLWEDGTAYLRATYLAMFGAITVTFTGDTHSNTTLDNLASGPPGIDLRTMGLVGAIVEGAGIPLGTTLVSFPSATSITLSAPATATASTVAIRVLPWGQGDGSTTFNVPNRMNKALFGRGAMNGAADPGLITGGTKLNATFGAQSATILQANLPVVNFNVDIPSGQGSHSHNVAPGTNFSAAAGAAATTYNSGAAGGSIATAAATLPAMTGTAASGGSGTALSTISPGGITNFLIKT